jgi:hypothetical protein
VAEGAELFRVSFELGRHGLTSSELEAARQANIRVFSNKGFVCRGGPMSRRSRASAGSVKALDKPPYRVRFDNVLFHANEEED